MNAGRRAVFNKSGKFIFRSVAGEDVLVPASETTRLRSFHVLNPTAAGIWSLIDGRRSAEDIARAIAETYDVGLERALRDVDAFLDRLAAIGAVSR